jgi:hypothetical protein
MKIKRLVTMEEKKNQMCNPNHEFGLFGQRIPNHVLSTKDNYGVYRWRSQHPYMYTFTDKDIVEEDV